MASSQALPPLPLPSGVEEGYIDCTTTCGLTFHFLETNRPPPGKALPLVLLVHGYPELAFTWRKVMPALGAAGYHVVAVDQRGYGRTTGGDMRSYHEVDMTTYRLTGAVRDMVTFINALGYDHAHCIVGHDFGAVTSAICALIRPDFFKSVVIMSHPFSGSPVVPFGVGRVGEASPDHEKAKDEDGDQLPRDPDVYSSMLKLSPPRKHYKNYNSTAPAAQEWDNPKQGVLPFMRGYLYLKSALYPENKPYPLKGWVATELAKLPYYYIMPAELSMPDTVAESVKGHDISATKAFMSDEDLSVYAAEFGRTGFQPSLNWYRSMTSKDLNADLLMFAGKKIECPSTFISGEADWGNCQEPGALEKFNKTCSDFRGVSMISNAGHWPQQEQPEKVYEEILKFLDSLK